MYVADHLRLRAPPKRAHVVTLVDPSISRTSRPIRLMDIVFPTAPQRPTNIVPPRRLYSDVVRGPPPKATRQERSDLPEFTALVTLINVVTRLILGLQSWTSSFPRRLESALNNFTESIQPPRRSVVLTTRLRDSTNIYKSIIRKQVCDEYRSNITAQLRALDMDNHPSEEDFEMAIGVAKRQLRRSHKHFDEGTLDAVIQRLAAFRADEYKHTFKQNIAEHFPELLQTGLPSKVNIATQTSIQGGHGGSCWSPSDRFPIAAGGTRGTAGGHDVRGVSACPAGYREEDTSVDNGIETVHSDATPRTPQSVVADHDGGPVTAIAAIDEDVAHTDTAVGASNLCHIVHAEVHAADTEDGPGATCQRDGSGGNDNVPSRPVEHEVHQTDTLDDVEPDVVEPDTSGLPPRDVLHSISVADTSVGRSPSTSTPRHPGPGLHFPHSRPSTPRSTANPTVDAATLAAVAQLARRSVTHESSAQSTSSGSTPSIRRLPTPPAGGPGRPAYIPLGTNNIRSAYHSHQKWWKVKTEPIQYQTLVIADSNGKRWFDTPDDWVIYSFSGMKIADIPSIIGRSTAVRNFRQIIIHVGTNDDTSSVVANLDRFISYIKSTSLPIWIVPSIIDPCNTPSATTYLQNLRTILAEEFGDRCILYDDISTYHRFSDTDNKHYSRSTARHLIRHILHCLN